MGEFEREISKAMFEGFDDEGFLAMRSGADQNETQCWLRVNARVDFNYAVQGTGPLHDRYVKVIRTACKDAGCVPAAHAEKGRSWGALAHLATQAIDELKEASNKKTKTA